VTNLWKLFVPLLFVGCADWVDCSAVDGNNIDGVITPFMATCAIEYGDVLYLDSGGGWVLAANEIGATAYETDTDTFAIGSCLSACVNILSAGKTRYMCADRKLGLHFGTDPYADALTYNFYAENERVDAAGVWYEMSQAPYWDVIFVDGNDVNMISSDRALELGLVDVLVDCGEQ